MAFNSESEMQRWIANALKEFGAIGELLSPDSIDPSNLTATNDSEKSIVMSYLKCVDSFWINEIISTNQNISINKGEILKPDFLLYAPETQSIVFVELKNIPGPTREAGTELGAYLGEVRTALPFVSDADVVHVIISNDWPTLLCHYIFNEIAWHKRAIACLMPILKNDNTIEFEWVPPRHIASGSVTPKICERHLGGFQICLYDEDLQEGSSNKWRLDAYVEQMKTAVQVMAATGNSQNSHGFAFLWRDHLPISLAPYSITVLNLIPFQMVERFLHLELDGHPFLIEQIFRVVREYDPDGCGEAISQIGDSCSQVLKHFCSPRFEGYVDWGNHRAIMSNRAEYIAFSAWGLFQESLIDLIKTKYQGGEIDIKYDSPILGMEVVNSIVDRDYPFIDISSYLTDSADEPNS